jgi:hypothetical protein
LFPLTNGLASAAIESLAQRTQVLTLRNHLTLRARDGLPQIPVRRGKHRVREALDPLVGEDPPIGDLFRPSNTGRTESAMSSSSIGCPSLAQEPIESGRDGRIRTGDPLPPSQYFRSFQRHFDRIYDIIVELECDPPKNARNIRERGISFERFAEMDLESTTRAWITASVGSRLSETLTIGSMSPSSPTVATKCE